MTKKYSEKIEVKELDKVIEAVNKDLTNEDTIQELLSETYSNADLEKQKLTFGQRAADVVAAFVGSWIFIIMFLMFLVTWILINSEIFAKEGHMDPYPFILLNLILSCLAAIQAPLVMMSQNRMAQIDRQKSENDYKVNLKDEVLSAEIYKELVQMREEQRKLRREISELNKKLNEKNSGGVIKA